MPESFSFLELFNKQILYGSILGIIIVVWFATQLAQRDSDNWRKEYSTSTKSTYLAILFFLASIICFTFFIIQWINSNETVTLKVAYDLHFASDNTRERWLRVHYSSIAMLMAFGFSFAALGCYALRFRPSPRSKWIKIRKCIAYYLVFSSYESFILFTAEELYRMNIMPEIISYKPEIIGYKCGVAISYGIVALAVWLLLRHYKNEKYFPYKRKEESFMETTHHTKLHILGNQKIQSEKVKQKPKIYSQIKDKKRMIAYYLIYEIIVFIISFILVIVEIVNEFEQVGITVALFAVLSTLPIGIYWIFRLLNESNSDNDIRK